MKGEEQERKKYHGKGPRSRMNRFARQKAEEYNDPVVDKE